MTAHPKARRCVLAVVCVAFLACLWVPVLTLPEWPAVDEPIYLPPSQRMWRTDGSQKQVIKAMHWAKVGDLIDLGGHSTPLISHTWSLEYPMHIRGAFGGPRGRTILIADKPYAPRQTEFYGNTWTASGDDPRERKP